LKVPVPALGQQQGKDKYQLFVKQDGKIQPRWVSIGINDRRYAEVKEGLKEGDIVVLPQLEGSNDQ
jgi:macrolide-specific efflux system membrane fusion protein